MRVSLFALLALGAAANAVTPMEKVITLLEDLKKETEDEGKNEAITYESFACWCQENSDGSSDHIKQLNKWIDDDSAKIGLDTATKEDKETDVDQRKKKMEELATELQANIAECNTEKTTYEATHADLQKALSSLHSAIDVMQGSKPSAAALLSLRKSVGDSLMLADALNLITQPKQKAVSMFLQQGTGVNPEDPDYKFHSQGIVDILDKLLTEFQANNDEVEAEWVKTRDACTQTQAALNGEITENKDAVAALITDIDGLTTDIGNTRKLLIESQASLTDLKQYLADLTKRCEVRAQDWDQRTQMRGKEVGALTQALEILTNQVKGMSDEVNQRSMLVQKSTVPELAAPRPLWATVLHAADAAPRPLWATVLKSEPAKETVVTKSLSFLQRSQGLTMQVRQDKALAILRKAGQRLGSPALQARLARRQLATPATTTSPSPPANRSSSR